MFVVRFCECVVRGSRGSNHQLAVATAHELNIDMRELDVDKLESVWGMRV
jgi:hypothetical protein